MTEVAKFQTQLSVLERAVADQQTRIGELEAENAELRAIVATIPGLQARIVELEQRLAKTSKTSSKPPSSDAPWTKPRRRGRPKKRKRGGQPDHPGQNRTLMSVEDVDHVINHRPLSCERCSALLLGEDPQPRRWQVAEIPKPTVQVIEHRVHRLRCTCCGYVSRGDVPSEVASAFGSRVHATTAWMTGRLGLSKRNAQEVFSTCFGLKLSVGSVSAIERRVAESLEEPYTEAWSSARGSPVIHADETPWYEDRRIAWLWVMTTGDLTVYRIQERRNKEAAMAFIGEDFAGTACTDRHGAYVFLAKRGFCWAHLRRNFEAMSLAPGGEWYGQRLRAAASQIMTTWYEHARGEIKDAQKDTELATARRQVEYALRWAAAQPHFESVQRQAALMLEQSDHLWTFLDEPGLPPDNNIAERAMRRGVLWRKRSYGTDSPVGSRFAERILTAVESLRAQDREVLGFLAEAYDAMLNKQSAPSLLP